MDEPAHVVKAASVAQGVFLGETGPMGHIVTLPHYIALIQEEPCTAFRPRVPASCQNLSAWNDATMTQTVTTAGQYNPLYYLLVGLPSLWIHSTSSVYAMRAISAILVALSLAIVVSTLATFRSRSFALGGVFLTATPSLFFLGGVVNPNAVEATTALAVFVLMYAIVTQRNTQAALLRERCLLLALTASFGVNTRGLSPLWFALALLLPLILTRRQNWLPFLKIRSVQLTIAAVFCATFFALWWIRTAGSLGGAQTDLNSNQTFPYKGASAITGIRLMVSGFFDLNRSLIGIFGWTEIDAPPITFFVWVGLISVTLLLWLVSARDRSDFVALLLLGSFGILPVLIQASYITAGGFIWQGRYAFPLFAMWSVATWLVVSRRLTLLPARAMQRGVAIALSAWCLGQFFAVIKVYSRFLSGTHSSLLAAILRPKWQSPELVLCTILLLGILLALSAYLAWRSYAKYHIPLPVRVKQRLLT